MQEPSARNQSRHNHIGIRLARRVGQSWEYLEALGWSEVGFNFYSAQDIPERTLALKRGLAHFEGSIVWRAVNHDDGVVLAMLVNELLFHRAREVAGNNPSLQQRLIKLMRTPAMVDEKRRVLASLGSDLSDAKLAALVARRKGEQSLLHYGVKVDAQAWKDIVARTLQVSDVVISMQKWSNALGA